MILAGLTCVAHGRPLPGNLDLGTDCLLMGRDESFDPGGRYRRLRDIRAAQKQTLSSGVADTGAARLCARLGRPDILVPGAARSRGRTSS